MTTNRVVMQQFVIKRNSHKIGNVVVIAVVVAVAVFRSGTTAWISCNKKNEMMRHLRDNKQQLLSLSPLLSLPLVYYYTYESVSLQTSWLRTASDLSVCWCVLLLLLLYLLLLMKRMMQVVGAEMLWR